MAFDTQAKRMSAVGINFMPGLSVEADGQETVQVRQAIGYSYAGSLTSAFEEARAGLITGLTASASPADGWNNKVRDGGVLQPKHVTRISDTVVHFDIPAIPLYDILSQEVVEQTIQAAAVVGGVGITATPTFTIDEVAAGGAMLKRFATMQGGIGANLTTGNMSGGMNA